MNDRGFSVLELMIVTTILAVLAALAYPSYRDFFERNRLRGAAEMVYGHLVQAKTIAIKRSKPITVEFASDPWTMGYTDKASCDPSGSDCTISDYNNDGDTSDAADNVATYFSDAQFKDVSAAQTFSDSDFVFEPLRGAVEDGANNEGKVVLTPASNRYEMQVVVCEEGFVRICSHTEDQGQGIKKLIGYPDCPADEDICP